MDKNAIQRLEQLAIAANGPPQHEGTYPSVLLPEGTSLKSLESLAEKPRRMRAHYETERIADFVRYVVEQAIDHEGKSPESESEPATAVFILPDGSGARAVIDLGSQSDPMWGGHKASLGMRQTPEFKALEAATRNALSQRDLTDFLEDWREIVYPYWLQVDPDEGEESSTYMTVSRAISAVRRVDINASQTARHEEGDSRRHRSAMETVEAEVSGGGQLPSGFIFECQMYPETTVTRFDVRMSLRTGGKEPEFKLRIVALEAQKTAVASEIESQVRSGVNSAARVFAGEIAVGQ